MYGLPIFDCVVIFLYFLVLVGIGIWASRRIKSNEDYLLGGRRFGKLLQTFAAFGQATSADGPVGVSTTTFRNGAAGIWSALLMVFCTPMFWITSAWLRRLRVITMGDFYVERYGSRRMAATYALLGSIGMMGLLSAGYTAIIKTGLAMTPKPAAVLTIEEKTEYNMAMERTQLENRDMQTLTETEKTRLEELRKLNPQSVFSHLNPHVLIWSIIIVVAIYAVMGGLEAAFYTDFLQGVFIIVLSVILVPFAWMRVNAIYGGKGIYSALETLHAQLPESFFQAFGSPTLIDFTWYYVAAVSLVAGITVVTQPNQLVTNAAARDEHSARVGMVTGSFMKRFCTILWGMFGLAAALLYRGAITDSDLLWGHGTYDLLGPIGFGLIGLMFIGMISALASTASMLMLTVSGLLVNNVYRLIAPSCSERHYVWAGRIIGLLFLCGGAFVSMQFDSLLQILKFIWEFFVIFAAAFWLGVKWRRATKAGAWASIIVTFAVFYLIPLVSPMVIPSLRTNEWLNRQTQPPMIEHRYSAREMDVRDREDEIAKWDALPASVIKGTRPVPLAVGDSFTKQFRNESKALFWSQDVRPDANGQMTGRGYLYFELIALDCLGFNLADNAYALNETIRILIRLAAPFVIVFLVSLVGRRDDPVMVDRFYAKMRTRVMGLGRDIDDGEVAAATANPAVTESVKLFPGSQWEFYKWNRRDILGFLFSIGAVIAVLVVLKLAVSIGG